MLKEEEIYRVLEDKVSTFKRREKNSEDRKTYDEVFDNNTLLVLYKLLTKGFLDTLDYPISTGKEGNVFKGTGNKGEMLAVKIYRTSTSTYKHLIKYITGDPRFRNVPKDRRSIVYLWGQKEFKNLARMFNAGIAVPEPKKQIKNVLIMGYIGNDSQPAPMLKDVPKLEPEKSFDIILTMMKKLYSEAKLVHGDLSEYNILVDNEKHFLIDVGQSVVLEHPLAEELLVRDVANIVRYFTKLGVRCDGKDMVSFIKG